MRKLLLVALLLYNLVAFAARPGGGYDYDDVEGNKRHSLIDDRRNWRKKALIKPIEEHKEYDKWRRDYEGQRYMEDAESKGFNAIDRQRDRELDMSASYRGGGNRRFDSDNNLQQNIIKSGEREGHPASYMEKEPEKKLSMSCDRPLERYEACFAGCASVSCDNPRDRLRPCYPFCEPGCVCIHPYVRDDRTHKCVLPEECTKGLKGIPDIGDEV
ncbi:uncharacterized protein LOC142979520 [Anticarsia gemmatalis]|uniref:uncharacterized protein LOC142979520 n=1 Tax=Anticarsia gemmatalis TaxID=129554 RepID=UPI003F75A90A